MSWSPTSRHARGYGAQWEKTRAAVLERDCYLCQCTYCKAEHRTTLATQVDHVVSRARAKVLGWSAAQVEHPDNLQSISEDCHKRKTMEEQGKQIKKSQPRVGLDGFAVAEGRRGEEKN
jgi:5-methylcytosine-specific restriction protein A